MVVKINDCTFKNVFNPAAAGTQHTVLQTSRLWLVTADVSHFDVSFVYAAFHEAPYDVWTMLLVDDLIKNRTT